MVGKEILSLGTRIYGKPPLEAFFVASVRLVENKDVPFSGGTASLCATLVHNSVHKLFLITITL